MTSNRLGLLSSPEVKFLFGDESGSLSMNDPIGTVASRRLLNSTDQVEIGFVRNVVHNTC